MYLLYTSDLPTTNFTLISTFADDTAIVSKDKDPAIASQQLQDHLNVIQSWLSEWRIKLNETKCVQVTFTLRKETCPPLFINGNIIPQQNDYKYLGIHLDRRLTWSKHIDSKKVQIKLKANSMGWLIGPHSNLRLEYKVLIYKSIIKPIWTYGIQMWGTATPSNVEKLQRSQSKVLRTITGAPWYVRNADIHKDLCITTIQQEIQKAAKFYGLRLQSHPNDLAWNLLLNPYNSRLKKKINPLKLILNE